MSKFRIRINGKGPNGPKQCLDEYDFYIAQNYSYFNDYGYKIRFLLYDNHNTLIGQISIYDKYQTPNEKIHELNDFDSYYRIIDELPDSFATSLSIRAYYMLTLVLPKYEDRIEFARALHVISYNSYTNFKGYDCYRIGGCRSPYNNNDVYRKRPVDILHERLFAHKFNYYDLAEKGMNIELYDNKKLRLRSSSNRIIWLYDLIDNDSSKRLFEIAMVLYNHYYNYNNEKNIIEPIDAAFNKIIFVSYNSNLHDYLVPNIYKELNQEDSNLYHYIGLQSRFDLGLYGDTKGNSLIIDNIPIRAVDDISDDLTGSLISGKTEIWSSIPYGYGQLYNDERLEKILKSFDTYVRTSVCYDIRHINKSDFCIIENKHKVFIHLIGSIFRNIQPYSIIMLDRPDMYLDIRQLYFLLGKLSEVCQEMKSVIIINSK